MTTAQLLAALLGLLAVHALGVIAWIACETPVVYIKGHEVTLPTLPLRTEER